MCGGSLLEKGSVIIGRRRKQHVPETLSPGSSCWGWLPEEGEGGGEGRQDRG